MHPMFYVSYLWPYLGPVPPLLPAPSLLSDADSGECEVEDILDSYVGSFVPMYLAKWLGYPVFESTWELALHLANARDIFH